MPGRQQASHAEEEPSRYAEGRRWIFPASLAAIALLVRFVFLGQLHSTPFFDHFFSDSRIYIDIAKSILAGHAGGKAVFMSPLYPYVLAIVEWATGNAALWMRILQCVIGAGTVLVVYAATARMFSRDAAYLAGLVVALYAPFVYYDNAIQIETLYAFFLACHLYALLRGLDKPSVAWLAAAGVFLGLSAALRSNIALFVPVLLVYLWRRKRLPLNRWIAAAAFTGAFLAVLVPFAVRNSSLAGEFVPVTSSGGLNLYAGNNPSADGLYRMPARFDAYADPSGSRIAERAEGRVLSPMEVSNYWAGKAYAWIEAHPAAFAGLFVRKLALFFHYDEIEQLGLSMAFIRGEYDTILDLPLLPFIAVLFLAVAGMVLAFRAKKDVLPYVLFAGSYVLATAVFFVNGRLRTPLAVVLAVFAGYALAVLIQDIKAKRWTSSMPALGASAIAVFLLSVFQPSYQQTFENEFSRLGDIAFAKGDYVTAQQYFTKSVASRPTAINIVNLGNALAAQGQYKKAEHAYEAAIRMDSTYAPAFFNKGNMAHQRGKPAVAFRYWMKTVSLDPAFAPAYRNLGLLLMQAGQLARARAMLERYVALETDAHQQAEIRRDIGKIDELLRRPAPPSE